MRHLHVDEWRLITLYLPIGDILSVLALSHTHYMIGTDNLWKDLLARDYPKYLHQVGRTYKSMYKSYYEFLYEIYAKYPLIDIISADSIYGFIVHVFNTLSKGSIKVYGITSDAIYSILKVTKGKKELWDLFLPYFLIKDNIIYDYHVSLSLENAAKKIWSLDDSMANKLVDVLNNASSASVIRGIPCKYHRDIVHSKIGQFYRYMENLVEKVTRHDILVKKVLTHTKGEGCILYVRNNRIGYYYTEYDLDMLQWIYQVRYEGGYVPIVNYSITLGYSTITDNSIKKYEDDLRVLLL